MKKRTFLMLFCTIIASSCTMIDRDMNLIAVKSDNGWGYVDYKGQYVINPQFDYARPFFDGLARVASDGKVGYISDDGKYVIQPQYQDGTDFSEGYAFVVTDNSYPICINKLGERLFTLKDVQGVTNFSEGLALYANLYGKIGYIDAKGTTVITPRFQSANNFHEGLAAIQIDEKCGYINKKGDIVIPCQFVRARDFHEGLAAVYNGKTWGFVNPKGEYIINPQFEVVSDFSDGLAAFSNGKMIGYIDKTGKYVINPQFEDVGEFHNGLAYIAMGEDLYGYINKDGKTVINPQFDDADDFVGSIAMVKSNDLVGFINKKGKYIINPQFEYACLYRDNSGSVASTYYDASEVVKNFWGTETSLGNILLSSFKEGSTLRSVAESKFGSANIYDYRTLKYDGEKISDDVRLDYIEFSFPEDIYETYVDYYYYEYNKKYKWGTPLHHIRCHFDLSDKAYRKGAALASAISIQLLPYISKMDHVDGLYWGYSPNHKYGIIIDYDNSNLDFTIYCIGKNEFNEIQKNKVEHTNNMSSYYSRYDKDWSVEEDNWMRKMAKELFAEESDAVEEPAIEWVED